MALTYHVIIITIHWQPLPKPNQCHPESGIQCCSPVHSSTCKEQALTTSTQMNSGVSYHINEHYSNFIYPGIPLIFIDTPICDASNARCRRNVGHKAINKAKTQFYLHCHILWNHRRNWFTYTLVACHCTLESHRVYIKPKMTRKNQKYFLVEKTSRSTVSLRIQVWPWTLHSADSCLSGW